MAMFMRENSSRTKVMARESIRAKMELFSKARGEKTSNMDRGKLLGLITPLMLETMKMATSKVMEYTVGPMGTHTTDSGMIIKLTDLVSTHGLMEEYIKETGKST
jgi:hypothetical protein